MAILYRTWKCAPGCSGPPTLIVAMRITTMFSYEKMASPVLGIRGLEADMSEEELAIQDSGQ